MQKILKMNVKEIKGDLFKATSTDVYVSLVHCISEDCRMGKGIATMFKSQFGGVDELLKQVQEGAKTGKVATLRREDRFIYYLITKKKCYDKPTYESLRSSIECMRNHALENHVQRLAMPRIGCGLDGLSWPIVSKMLRDVFADTGIEVNVYSL